MVKTRLHHFDMLKGIAIFLVVIGHVLTMCIRDIDNAVLFKFVEKIHMPLFFFISGYFTYKVQENGKLATPDILLRVKQLLLPFFVVSALWIYYFPHSGLLSPFISTWDGLYFSVGKNGYWFTLCLFEIILLYCVMIPVLTRCRSARSKSIMTISIWIVLGLLSKFVLSAEVCALIGLPLVFEFFPVFMAGVVARSATELFDRVTASSMWVTVALTAGSVLMYYVCWPWELALPAVCIDLAKQLLYLCVVIVAIAVVKPWSLTAFGGNTPRGTAIARLCEYLGTQSLAIYLLHYFFLFPMAIFREPLISMNLNIVPTLVVAGIVAAIIICVVLGVNYIICKSKLLALLLTGKVK